MAQSERQVKAKLSAIRKHWSYRLIVGIMAIVGCITTISSLYSDVLLPVFFQHGTVAREIELVDLLRMFTPATEGTGVSWITGAEETSPIEWQTDEPYAERHGTTTVLLDGRPTHEQFDKTVHPAVWDIGLTGCMATVDRVVLSGSGTGYNEPPSGLTQALSRYLQLTDTHPMSGSSFVGKLYQLNLPSREQSWLVESWSIGNHAWFVELTLFPGKDSYAEAKEYLVHLLDEPEQELSQTQ